MCNPTAVLVLQGAAAAVSAFGVMQRSRAASQEADFKSRIASNNATIAANNADAVLEKAKVDTIEKRRETRQKVGLQRAQLAAAGFEVGTGTSIDILADTEALGEFDILRLEADAERRAQNFRNQAAGFQTEASLGRLASKKAITAGRIESGATLITGAARAGRIFLDKKP